MTKNEDIKDIDFKVYVKCDDLKIDYDLNSKVVSIKQNKQLVKKIKEIYGEKTELSVDFEPVPEYNEIIQSWIDRARNPVVNVKITKKLKKKDEIKID